MDPNLTAHMMRNPKQMETLDELAGKYGQDIQIALLPPGVAGWGPPGTLGVMYADGTPLAIVGPSGQALMLNDQGEDDDE